MVSLYTSVVIHDLNVVRSVIGPDETDSILVVDSDTALPLSVSRKRFEPVSWRNLQFSEEFD